MKLTKLVAAGVFVLPLILTPIGILNPAQSAAAASHCTSVDSTWWSAQTAPFVAKAKPADSSDYFQTHDLTYKECATRTSSTAITIKWSWQIHHNAKDLDSVVPLYVWNCSTGKASKAKASMEYAKGTSLKSGSGVKTFTVSAGTKYKAGFAGSGDLNDPSYAYPQHFSAAAPSPIVPFKGRTSCI